MFRVGQQVECINGDGLLGLIKTGQKVTISHIHSHPTWGDILGLEFSDAPPAPPDYTGYNSRLFRPIVEKKTDISIFTEMLTPTKIKEKV
jgi:hypothetical protein